MTVRQLIDRLSTLPPDAVVLLETDGGLARLAAMTLEASQTPGLPDEVILFTDAEE